MSITLQGNSPAALTAGILLLSKSRSFGQRFKVEVVGDPDDIATVEGPALLYSPLLSTVTGSREPGGLVLVPGPTRDPLALCLVADGAGPWFEVDRAGLGLHPATRALVALGRDSRHREAARSLRRALGRLGVVAEPAILDLLFGAPVPALHRISLAIRASRALGHRGDQAPTQLLAWSGAGQELLPSPLSAEAFGEALRDGRAAAMLDRLQPWARHGALGWLDELGADALPGSALGLALAELLGQLTALPRQGLLPALDPAMEAVATHLGQGLAAQAGPTNANGALVDTFRFLGGRFTDDAHYPVEMVSSAPPEGRLDRWRWLCDAVRASAAEADALWRTVWDPPM